jgi:Flp pilus assembly protein TadG
MMRIWGDERGNSLIEMALVTPVLATLLVGTVDLSRSYSTKLQVEQAAQHTLELIQVSDYKTTNNSVYQAEAQTAAGTGSAATVNSWLECNADGVHLDYDTGTCANATDPYARYVQVTVSQSFTPLFGTRFFPGANSNGTVTVRATAGVRTQ